MEKYRSVSSKIHRIFERYTSLIEPLSLDEAYLDVTECSLFDGDASAIAQAIRDAVRSEVGITISAGIAPNKFSPRSPATGTNLMASSRYTETRLRIS